MLPGGRCDSGECVQSKNTVMSKTLILTLHKKAFEVMITGEKSLEFRKNSSWIRSRLYKRKYDFVEFRNGYSVQAPSFTAKFLTAVQSTVLTPTSFEYSNGLKVRFEKDDWMIILGEIINKSNIK